MEAARSMLHDQDLPMHLWAEAARTTMYVQSHTPHRVIENKTLEEVFSCKKQEVIHLRIFGYPVYIHIPKGKRTKLDPSRKKGIFVGYSKRSKAYRIYFLGFKKIEILQLDNGVEFTSNEFKELCRDLGIKRELTTPYNPQQNGVVERNNRTIMEAARAMLHVQYLPMHLWDKLQE